jgi:hypothetical protein
VKSIYPGEGLGAEKAGIKKDDIVLKLGPLTERELNEASIYHLCETYEGQTIEVEVSRAGEPQPIKMELFILKKWPLFPRRP